VRGRNGKVKKENEARSFPSSEPAHKKKNVFLPGAIGQKAGL
jgi:hypothetical protein